MSEVWAEASPALPGSSSVLSPASLVFSTAHSRHEGIKKKKKLPLAKRKRVRKEQKKKGKEKFLRRTK